MRAKWSSGLLVILLMIIDLLPALIICASILIVLPLPDTTGMTKEIVISDMLMLTWPVAALVLFPCGLFIRKRYFLSKQRHSLSLILTALTFAISIPSSVFSAMFFMFVIAKWVISIIV